MVLAVVLVNMVELEIYNINNVQADGFMDSVSVKKAPIFLGMHESRLESERPLSFKDDDSYLIRPIQDIFHPKYKIQFLVNGEYWVEQLRYARKILIKQEDESNQDAVVLDFTREHIANDAYKCEMTYFDRADDAVAEYLKSSWLSDTNQDLELYTFKYADEGNIYTRIRPTPISPAPEQETYNNSDVDTLVKSVLKQTKTFTFYLSGEDLEALQAGMHHYACSITSLGDQAQVLPSPNITQLGGWDIYRVDIDFIYNIQKVYTS